VETYGITAPLASRDPAAGDGEHRPRDDIWWYSSLGYKTWKWMSFYQSNPGLVLAGGQPSSRLSDFIQSPAGGAAGRVCQNCIMAAKSYASAPRASAPSRFTSKRRMQLPFFANARSIRNGGLIEPCMRQATAMFNTAGQWTLTKGESDQSRPKDITPRAGSSHGRSRRGARPQPSLT